MDLQPIAYTYGPKSFTGYLADGSGGAKAPGVLVVHEGGGLSGHAKDKARALAGLGYVAFAMDLYGQTGLPLDQARALLMALREDLDELRGRAGAALAVLSGHANVDAARLAAIGFCFGGTTVFELARAGADLKAVVGFHAGLATSRPAAAGVVRGKLMACQGADDPIILAPEREAFCAEMTAAGADWQMLVLGGVGHSFTNPEIDALGFPGFVYDTVADRRSWAAMRGLFGEVF
jgi:dienelactone hydrolase